MALCTQLVGLFLCLLLALSNVWHTPWRKPPLRLVRTLIAFIIGYDALNLYYHAYPPTSAATQEVGSAVRSNARGSVERTSCATCALPSWVRSFVTRARASRSLHVHEPGVRCTYTMHEPAVRYMSQGPAAPRTQSTVTESESAFHCARASLKQLAFCLISFCRWAADATIVLGAFARYTEAKLRLERATDPTIANPLSRRPVPAGGLEAPLLQRPSPAAKQGAAAAAADAPFSTPATDAAPAHHPTFVAIVPPHWRVGIALGVGVLMTVPWALAYDFVHEGHGGDADADDGFGDLGGPEGYATAQADALGKVVHTHLPLWVPYGASQAVVYAVAYALIALALLTSSSVVLRINAQTHAALEQKCTDMSPGLLHTIERLRAAHSFYVRFECFTFITATRVVLSCAICSQLASSPALSGAMALMLLVSSLLSNATGFLLFALFGLGEGVLHAPFQWARDQLSRALAAASRRRHAVAVEEVEDLIGSAAAGSGFAASAQPLTAVQRSKAARAIQRSVHRRHSHEPS